LRISALTIAGVLFLFIGIIELGAVGFTTSAPIFGAIGSPGVWGVLVGLVLIVIGTRRRGFSGRKPR
jgi:hypothetical protein